MCNSWIKKLPSAYFVKRKLKRDLDATVFFQNRLDKCFQIIKLLDGKTIIGYHVSWVVHFCFQKTLYLFLKFIHAVFLVYIFWLSYCFLSPRMFRDLQRWIWECGAAEWQRSSKARRRGCFKWKGKKAVITSSATQLPPRAETSPGLALSLIPQATTSSPNNTNPTKGAPPLAGEGMGCAFLSHQGSYQICIFLLC